MATSSGGLSASAVEEVRKRSVDNLQTLYSVVTSLAVTSMLTRVFVGPDSTPNFAHVSTLDWLMVIGFVITIVPFYHGANRYLDATYVTGERAAKRFGLLIDFIMLFIEAALFFVIALFVGESQTFYLLLAGLLLFDGIWVLMSEFLWGVRRPRPQTVHLSVSSSASRPPHHVSWMAINFIAAGLILFLVWLPLDLTNLIRNISLAAIIIVRTIVDYSLVWAFYYPPTAPAITDDGREDRSRPTQPGGE